MGLSASQARILLLTARKSDLEYRAQQITHRKTLLSMETEQVATRYSEALNNTRIFFSIATMANEGKSVLQELTYARISSSDNMTRYRIVDRQGKVIVTQADYELIKSGKDEKYVMYEYKLKEDADTTAVRTSRSKPNTDLVKDNTLKEIHTTDGFVANAGYDAILNNPEGFQNALRAGIFYIEEIQEDATTAEFQGWNKLSVAGNEDFQIKNYSDDDKQAEAEYNRETLKLQNADKRLDVELQQIQSQQKACETEIDSVKQLVNKNIDSSYKIFSNG